MRWWQQLLVSLYGLISFIGLVKSYRECRYRRNPYGKPYNVLFYQGSFVWADHLIIGTFWVLVSMVTLGLQDWLLFLLTISLFWLVRAFGEMTYWFHQQFNPRGNEGPEKFWFKHIVHNEAAWFVHQIFWQCITVTTIITSLYLAKLWLVHASFILF